MVRSAAESVAKFTSVRWASGSYVQHQPGDQSRERLGASLVKEFPIREHIRLQFRTEIFNLFNQTNFGQPGASIAFLGTNPAGVANSVPPVNLTGSHSPLVK